MSDSSLQGANRQRTSGGRKADRFRQVDGVLVLDKPKGLTSNDALQRVKRLARAAKAGHSGSLDPLATGALPLCFGEATKLSQFLLGADKRYRTTIKLGVRTDSGDAEGKEISRSDVGGVTETHVRAVIDEFIGELDQIPSMFSAIKVDGQPLYKLARQGIEVERQPRRITIYEHRFLSMMGDEVVTELRCSKGTYVRSLAQDMGERLGCGAHVVELRRLQAGPYSETEMVGLDVLERAVEENGPQAIDAFLLPSWSAVRDWPEVCLEENSAYYIGKGQSVMVPHSPTKGWVRLHRRRNDAAMEFMGVGEVLDDGRIAPRRLMAA